MLNRKLPVSVGRSAASPAASDPCDKFTLPALFHLVYCGKIIRSAKAERLMPSYLHKRALFSYFGTACHMSGLPFGVNRVTQREESASGYRISY